MSQNRYDGLGLYAKPHDVEVRHFCMLNIVDHVRMMILQLEMSFTFTFSHPI